MLEPGQALRWSAGNRARAARQAGLPRLKEHAVPRTGPLRVVLDGIAEVLVEGHGLLPGGGFDLRSARVPGPARPLVRCRSARQIRGA
jgi:hypothetical protein